MLESAGTALTTVIDISDCHTCITAKSIQRCIERYGEVDDVFHIRFLEVILFRGGDQEHCPLSTDARALLQGFGMRWYQFLDGQVGKQPHPGPCVILNGALHEVLRLYADTHAAFFQATRYSIACYRSSSVDIEHRGRSTLEALGDNHGQVSIAVPSRLHSHISHKISHRLPLSGIRVGVKDNFDLKGTKTSLCSRSYLQVYPKKKNSATCLQKLLVDLGVSIIGKTKLCAFAQWEEPTEAIEYTSPWSPRADGFQSSGGSSNGSGVAVAAYDWLDITIGSDSKTILLSANWDRLFTSISDWEYPKASSMEWLFCSATHFWGSVNGRARYLH